MRDQVKTLTAELDELHRQAELRTTLDSIDERLARLEARSAGMKVSLAGRRTP